MATLVTGGAGFIGSNLCARLLDMGRDVVCLDDFNDYYSPARKWANIQGLQASPRFHLERLTITDQQGLRQVFERHAITEIVHLAARAGVRPSLREPVLYGAVNVQGTLHLLELSREHHVARFVFGGSSSVYGVGARAPFHEEDAADRPISPYAATKRAGELLCHTYAHLYGIPMLCLRFFSVYGPRQRPDLALPRFTQAMLSGQAITLYGDGNSARDYTYVGDVVDAVVAGLRLDPAPLYEIVNIGNSSPLPLHALVEQLEEALGVKAAIRSEPDQPGDVPLTYASIEKAKSLLGWQPRVPLAEGIRQFVAWYRVEEAGPAASPAASPAAGPVAAETLRPPR